MKVVLSVMLFVSMAAQAATVTNFTVTQQSAGTTGTFLTSLNPTFSGPTALLSGSSISCSSTSIVACSGPVLAFTIEGTGLDSTSPFLIDIDGSLTNPFGANPATTAAITVTAPLSATIPFSIPAGSFSRSVLSSSLPAVPNGAFSITGTLSVLLEVGQVLSLPSSLTITVADPTAVPEPGTIGAGLLGLLLLFKRRV